MLLPHAAAHGLDIIRLVAPTTDDARLPHGAGRQSGFVYYVSITGVTGTRTASAEDLADAIPRIRSATDLPIAVGFGVRTPAQAAEACARRRRRRGRLGADRHARRQPGRKGAPARDRSAVCSTRCGPRRGAAVRQRMPWLRVPSPGRLASHASAGRADALAHRISSARRSAPCSASAKCRRTSGSMPGLPADDLPPRLAKTLKVCPHCGHHMRATRRGAARLDLRRRQLHPHRASQGAGRPAALPRRKRYTDRLQRSAREDRAATTPSWSAHGTIGGQQAVVAAMEFEFIGGSMGAAVGEGIVAAARLAMLQEAPLIVSPPRAARA